MEDVNFTPHPVFSPFMWLCLCADTGAEDAFLISCVVTCMKSKSTVCKVICIYITPKLKILIFSIFGSEDISDARSNAVK